MRFYQKQNVMDAAIDRIRYLFDEFPNVTVCFSGGKDSTVVLNLALKVAEEKGRLPLNVMFLDQEAEWATVIDYVREVMYDPRVKPLWFQVPIRLFNSTSTTDPWLKCWEPGVEWMREQDPISIKESTVATDRFVEFFDEYMDTFPSGQVCYLAGVRTEESPVRMLGLTTYACYKAITWGRAVNKKKGFYNFHPIYDWSYTDVWKAIHDNGWPYCKVYDYMYQYGLPVSKMRVSNVHHETAIHTLFYLQEIEGETWQRLTKRISGINTAGQMKSDAFVIKDLPPMFSGWKEYRDYLLENLITDAEAMAAFKKDFNRMDKTYATMNHLEGMYKAHISVILTNDYHGTKLNNWERSGPVFEWLRYQKGIRNPSDKKNRYINAEL